MKVITKEWTKVYREVQEGLQQGDKDRATEDKIAWLEERAGKALASSVLDLDDFVYGTVDSHSQNADELRISVEGVGEIAVKNPTILEDERDGSWERLVLRGVETYALTEKEQELHLLLESAEGEYYLTIQGEVAIQ